MLLQWVIDQNKYHYFNLYSIKGHYVCVDLMVDKTSNLVCDNSLLVLSTEYKKFLEIKNIDLNSGKRLMLDKVLACSDHLVDDPIHANLDRNLLKEDILNLTETFIQYKIKEGMEREQNDPKKCDFEAALVLTDEPLASDEKML